MIDVRKKKKAKGKKENNESAESQSHYAAVSHVKQNTHYVFYL